MKHESFPPVCKCLYIYVIESLGIRLSVSENKSLFDARILFSRDRQLNVPALGSDVCEVGRIIMEVDDKMTQVDCCAGDQWLFRLFSSLS